MLRNNFFFLAMLVLTSTSCVHFSTPTQIPADGKTSWFIFLEKGKPTPDNKAAVASMQRGHIDNFKRLHAEKKLLAAGPLRDPSGFKRGYVIDLESVVG